MRQTTLCADDYGLSPAVSRGIADLVAMGRLNAVGAMTVSPFLDPAPLIEARARAPGPVQIGLHLTFTEYAALGPMPDLAPGGSAPGIGALIGRTQAARCVPGRVARIEQQVRDEIRRQTRRFVELFGFAPDFVDGHQHAHLMTGINRALARHAAEELDGEPWIRICRAPIGDLARLGSGKVGLLNAFSAQLAPRLRHHGLRSNRAFYGVNDFSTAQPFGGLMRRWLELAGAREGALIMCHPGHEAGMPGEGLADPIAARRPQELAYLASDHFPRDMERAGVTLGA